VHIGKSEWHFICFVSYVKKKTYSHVSVLPNTLTKFRSNLRNSENRYAGKET